MGEFREMADTAEDWGFPPGEESHHLPRKSMRSSTPNANSEQEPIFNLTVNMKHQSLARPALRPLTLGHCMFDVVADPRSTFQLRPWWHQGMRSASAAFAPIAAEVFLELECLGNDGGSRERKG